MITCTIQNLLYNLKKQSFCIIANIEVPYCIIIAMLKVRNFNFDLHIFIDFNKITATSKNT